jgi:hypothetical protein
MRHGGFAWLLTQTESDADRVLKAIVTRRPELLTGYRIEWNDRATASPTAMMEEIERRAEAFERLSEDEREQWIDDRFTELHHFVRRTDSASQVGTLLRTPTELPATSEPR